MVRRLFLFAGLAILSFATAADAHGPAPGVRYGGYYYPHHGHAFYGPYRPGLYAPYGYYRPYGGLYGAGLGVAGFGLGLGLGYGLGSGLGGGYGLGGGLGGGYGMYRPYYGGTTIVNPTTVVVAPPAGTPAGAPAGAPVASGPAPGQTQEPPQAPPADNLAHLQLVVPENAEVLFGGEKTSQTGPVREFVSPPLPAGKLYDYTVVVRYTDANGKPVSDRRVIHVRANDWYRIDFTRPAPPEPLPAP